MEEKFRWIKNDIDISGFYDKLPGIIKEIIHEAEETDRNDDLGNYVCLCDDLECRSKLFIPDRISEKEWDLLCEKYSVS